MTTERHKRRYTDKEINDLQYDIGYVAPREIAKKLGRTIRGIVSKAETLGLNTGTIAKRSAGMSSTDVVQELGIVRRTLIRFVHSGCVPAYRREISWRENTNRSVYTFDPHELEQWLRTRGALLTLHPTDVWREIYEDARKALKQRHVSRNELCGLRLPKNLVDCVGFPHSVITATANTQYYDCAAVARWLALYRPHYLSPAVRERLGVAGASLAHIIRPPRPRQRFAARRGVGHRPRYPHSLSVERVARELDVKPARVRRWIARKWLPVCRVRVGGERYTTVSRNALRGFLCGVGALLDGLDPLDRWLVLTPTQEAFKAQHVTANEVAQALGIPATRLGIGEWITSVQFPVPAYQLEHRRKWYRRCDIQRWLQTASKRYRTKAALELFGLEE